MEIVTRVVPLPPVSLLQENPRRGRGRGNQDHHDDLFLGPPAVRLLLRNAVHIVHGNIGLAGLVS